MVPTSVHGAVFEDSITIFFTYHVKFIRQKFILLMIIFGEGWVEIKTGFCLFLDFPALRKCGKSLTK